MVLYCVVPGCRTSALEHGISFHYFPKDRTLREMWVTRVNLEETLIRNITSTMRVCSKHFLHSDYRETPTGLRRLLKEGAIPSVFSFSSTTDDPELPCISDSNSIVLRDGELLVESKSSVSGLNKVLSYSEKLGQWHLTEESTDKTSSAETSCPVSIKTEKPDLEDAASPTLLSNLPAKLDSSVPKIIVSSANMLVTVKKEPIDDIPLLENSNNISEDIQKWTFSYEVLEKHLEKVLRPNSWWTVSSCPDYVICTKWNACYACERKVVVCKDMTTKVFLNNVRILLDSKVYSFEGLSSLLHIVDEL